MTDTRRSLRLFLVCVHFFFCQYRIFIAFVYHAAVFVCLVVGDNIRGILWNNILLLIDMPVISVMNYHLVIFLLFITHRNLFSPSAYLSSADRSCFAWEIILSSASVA